MFAVTEATLSSEEGGAAARFRECERGEGMEMGGEERDCEAPSALPLAVADDPPPQRQCLATLSRRVHAGHR